MLEPVGGQLVAPIRSQTTVLFYLDLLHLGDSGICFQFDTVQVERNIIVLEAILRYMCVKLASLDSFVKR